MRWQVAVVGVFSVALAGWNPSSALAQGAGPAVPPSVAESIAYLRLRADNMGKRYEAQAAVWRARADRYERAATEGRDPYPAERGKIVTRAYRSEVTGTLQGYAVYLPEGYDPRKPWPMVVVLHGGSSNGNLFLGVVLGNNMDWLKYQEYWWNEFDPAWKPNCIVVSPDGFGQVMWRWMGEHDVLSVIEDARRHYHVDENRIVLAGLSNGGVGAYAIGTRHAWRFSVVQAMAGAPSWLQYVGGRPLAPELRALRPLSGMDLALNVANTDFRYYHGHTDGGPMKPRYVHAFTERLAALGVTAKETWYDTGHDILYLVEKHGRTFGELTTVARNPRPQEVRLVTGDYRAPRQHWLEVTRIADYPSLAILEGKATSNGLAIQANGAKAFTVHVKDALDAGDGTVTLTVNGQTVYVGPRAPLGDRVSIVARNGRFALGFPESAHDPNPVDDKRPGVSGPLTDAYFGHTVHVFGTANPETREALEKAARRGAKGWPLWLWNFDQPVVADTDVTPEMMARSHLVLYTTGTDHHVYNRVRDRLPIRIHEAGVTLGDKVHGGPGVGTRFIHPNPLSPNRYVIVQGGPSVAAVDAGHRLPDFLPDYVIYDATSTKTRPRLVQAKAPLALGYFDDTWRIPGASPEAKPAADPPAPGEDAQASPPSTASTLPVPAAPPAPPAPKAFLAGPRDPAGRAARDLARRVARFPSYRTQVPGGEWATREGAMWRIQPKDECEAALRKAGVPFRPVDLDALPEPGDGSTDSLLLIPSPVVVTGKVGGVDYRMLHSDRELLMSCELALRLPALSRVLREAGVRSVGVISSHRPKPYSSFHTFGLALDMSKFWFDDGTTLTVEKDFQATPNERTCAGAGTKDRLRALACRIADLGIFASVLTPNYNEGHRDHFHVDVRPDDPRQFTR